jgi:hypothetical protein
MSNSTCGVKQLEALVLSRKLRLISELELLSAVISESADAHLEKPKLEKEVFQKEKPSLVKTTIDTESKSRGPQRKNGMERNETIRYGIFEVPTRGS